MEKKQLLINFIEKQDLQSLKVFVSENTDFPFNFTTDKGRNLLHYAAEKISGNTLSIIQLLVEKGVDPLSLDEKFESAIDVAKSANNIPAMTIMKHFVNKKSQEEQAHH